MLKAPTREDALDNIDRGGIERAESFISLSPAQDVSKSQSIASKSASGRLEDSEPPLQPSVISSQGDSIQYTILWRE